MPTYLSPGVYVQEVSSGSKPIEGVGTAVAAFVGLTEKGPANAPTLVTNWTQFNSVFGDFVEGSYLAHAVYGYFLNGGGSAYIVRIGSDGESPQPSARAELAGRGEPGRPVYRVTAAEGGPAGDDISVEIGDPGESGEDTFKVSVSRGGKVEEVFDNLSTKKGPTNAATVVKARSKLIRLEEIGSGGAVTVPEKASVKLSGGTSAAAVRVTADDYVGNSADRTGFAGLEAVDEVTMLSVPDVMAAYQRGIIDLEAVQAVQLAMIAHCELMGDRVAILDAPPGLNAQQVKEWRVDKAGYDSKYAALYWPWIKVFDPLKGQGMMIPPSGHVAGIWARNDDTRGVHKAPANEVVRGAITLELQITKGEHDQLNPSGHQLHSRVPGPRGAGLGRAHHLERPGVAIPQRPPPVQLRRGVDPRGHAVGRLRAQRLAALGRGEAQRLGVPAPRVARRRALRHHRSRGLLRQVRRREQHARTPSTSGS